MLADLTGRTALVTGAGRPGSMGAGIAAVLVRQGARVALTDVDETSMRETIEAVGGAQTFGLTLDVADTDSVRCAFGRALESFGDRSTSSSTMPASVRATTRRAGAGRSRSTCTAPCAAARRRSHRCARAATGRS